MFLPVKVELVGWLGFPESIFLSSQNLEFLLGFSSHCIQFNGVVIWGPHSLRQGVGMETRTIGHVCLEYASYKHGDAKGNSCQQRND